MFIIYNLAPKVNSSGAMMNIIVVQLTELGVKEDNIVREKFQLNNIEMLQKRGV